jgi:hypothetical protein
MSSRFLQHEEMAATGPLFASWNNGAWHEVHVCTAMP